MHKIIVTLSYPITFHSSMDFDHILSTSLQSLSSHTNDHPLTSLDLSSNLELSDNLSFCKGIIVDISLMIHQWRDKPNWNHSISIYHYIVSSNWVRVSQMSLNVLVCLMSWAPYNASSSSYHWLTTALFFIYSMSESWYSLQSQANLLCLITQGGI